MAPKQVPISELGAPASHGNGYRAQANINGIIVFGPQRATKKEAEADLALARQSTSRDAYARCFQEMRAAVKKEEPVKQEPVDGFPGDPAPQASTASSSVSTHASVPAEVVEIPFSVPLWGRSWDALGETVPETGSVDDTDGGEPGPGGSGGPSRGGHSSASASGVKRPGPSAGEASRQKRPRKPGQAGANVEDVDHGGKSLDCDVAKMEHQLQTALAQEDYAGAAQVQAEMKEARAEMKEVRSQHGDAACALEERRQAEKAARTRLEADLAEMGHQLQTAVAQEDYAGAAQVQAEMKEARAEMKEMRSQDGVAACALEELQRPAWQLSKAELRDNAVHISDERWRLVLDSGDVVPEGIRSIHGEHVTWH